MPGRVITDLLALLLCAVGDDREDGDGRRGAGKRRVDCLRKFYEVRYEKDMKFVWDDGRGGCRWGAFL